MKSQIDMKLKVKKIDGWVTHALEFAGDKSVIMTVVLGKLANVQTKSGKKKRLSWQQQIAKGVKSKRGIMPRNKNGHYAVSLGMVFQTQPNQKQPLDIDNFIKPIFAGIAAGLFLDDEETPTRLEKFKDYDDSHFEYLYVEHLGNKQNEGVVIVISEKPE